MKVRVSEQQIEIGSMVPHHMRKFTESMAAKRPEFTLALLAHEEVSEAHRAFDAALEHSNRQFRRYERHPKNHHERAPDFA